MQSCDPAGTPCTGCCRAVPTMQSARQTSCESPPACCTAINADMFRLAYQQDVKALTQAGWSRAHHKATILNDSLPSLGQIGLQQAH